MIENNFGKHYVLCPGMILWQSENSYSNQLSIQSYFFGIVLSAQKAWKRSEQTSSIFLLRIIMINDYNVDGWMEIDSKIAQIYMRTLAEYSIKCSDKDIVLGTDNFLGENEAQAQQIFKQVRKIYSSRSSAVHGNKTKDNLESAVEESANLLTRILRRCAELNKLPDVDNLAFRVDKQKQGIKCKILVP